MTFFKFSISKLFTNVLETADKVYNRNYKKITLKKNEKISIT